MYLNWCSATSFLFQSTLPAGGATGGAGSSADNQVYFNPRSPRGERHYPSKDNWNVQYISIHAPRGGSDFDPEAVIHLAPSISIHAPRGGSDVGGDSIRTDFTNFNPRSPRGERQERIRVSEEKRLFQSTLPAGGATISLSCCCLPFNYFNPRSPRGERQDTALPPCLHVQISIHAPRGGSDSKDYQKLAENLCRVP